MTNQEELFARALALPANERQRLLHELALSLEPASAEEEDAVRAAWGREVARRADRLRSRESGTVDGREVIDQAIARMRAAHRQG